MANPRNPLSTRTQHNIPQSRPRVTHTHSHPSLTGFCCSPGDSRERTVSYPPLQLSSSTAVVQATVNRPIAGSNPASAAILTVRSPQEARPCVLIKTHYLPHGRALTLSRKNQTPICRPHRRTLKNAPTTRPYTIPLQPDLQYPTRAPRGVFDRLNNIHLPSPFPVSRSYIFYETRAIPWGDVMRGTEKGAPPPV